MSHTTIRRSPGHMGVDDIGMTAASAEHADGARCEVVERHNLDAG